MGCNELRRRVRCEQREGSVNVFERELAVVSIAECQVHLRCVVLRLAGGRTTGLLVLRAAAPEAKLIGLR